MRLPWPLSLIQRAPTSGDAAFAAGRGAAVGNLGPDSVSAGPKRDLGEWRKVPPIHEVVGPPPLVAPNAPFAADLGAGHAPPPILAPLGHGRGLDAPRGLVVGIAKPVQRAPETAGPGPLVQRRRAEPSLPTSQNQGSVAEMAPEVPAVPLAAPSAPTPIEPVIKPRRVATVVAPLQRAPLQLARVGDREQATIAAARVSGVISDARPHGGPLEQAQRRAEPAPSPTSTPGTGTARLDSPRSAQLALTGPVARKPSHDYAPTQSATAPARLTLGQSRRVGLGAPIATAPPTAAALTAQEPTSALPLPTTVVQRKLAPPDTTVPLATASAFGEQG